jgi:hypothetical protein
MAEKASVYAGFGGFEWINSKPPIFIDAALFLRAKSYIAYTAVNLSSK